MAGIDAASGQQRFQAGQQGWQLLAPCQEGLQAEPLTLPTLKCSCNQPRVRLGCRPACAHKQLCQ